MVRLRIDRQPARFVFLKTAIFFLGAGTWIAGVVMDDRRITGAAIVMLAVGILLRFKTTASKQPEGVKAESEPPE